MSPGGLLGKAPLRRLAMVLLAGLGMVLLLQQLLLQRPPRVLKLRQATASSGPAALKLTFSRPMDRASVEEASALSPALRFGIQGKTNPLLLLPEAGQRITAPLAVRLAGHDQRGLPLDPSVWHWDPRLLLVAVVLVEGAEQVQLRQSDGRWIPLSPVWAAIPDFVPLGDGSGVGLVSRDGTGAHHVWKLSLDRDSLSRSSMNLGQVQRKRLERFGRKALLFAHLSTNRFGDLLVQVGGTTPASDRVMLWQRNGHRQELDLVPSGPVALLPQGGAVVVPERDGLSLRSFPPSPPLRQVLPGSRDLSSFCPVAGRALLLRHWPDFRRSLEIVEPGRAPRALWMGEQALVASACSRGGERIWALLIEGIGRPTLTVLALDRQGKELGRQKLEGWELEPGTGLHYDPTGDRLLLALRALPPPGSEPVLSASSVGGLLPEPATAQPALIDANTLQLSLVERPVRRGGWLPPG